MDYTSIFEAIIMLIVAILTTFVIPWIKRTIDEADLAQTLRWVKIAVQAAEIIFTEAGMGIQKKQYVLEFLESKGILLDGDEINAMIEAAVLELKNELGEWKNE